MPEHNAALVYDDDMVKFRETVRGGLTTDEAAELCGITPASFRKAMTRERRDGNDYRLTERPLVLWSEPKLRKWLAGRPGRGRWAASRV